MGGLSNGPIPDPHVPHNYSNRRTIEKSPFQIAAERLEVDENVNRARSVRHFLALNFYLLNNGTAFAKTQNE